MDYTSKKIESSKVLNTPKFLIDIERNIKFKIPRIKKTSSELFKKRQEYLDKILQVYRDAFDDLLKNLTTYKPLLTKIKEAYEDSLSIRDRHIDMNEIIMNAAWKPYKENTFGKKIEEQTKEIESLKNDLQFSSEKNASMTEKIKALESEIQTLNLALTTERDARYALFFENNKLKSEILDLSKFEKGKDPVILSIALEQCRKKLSKAIKDLNAMSDDYADTIPRKEYELLETNHIVLLRDFNSLSANHQDLANKHEELTKEHNQIKDEVVELRDRCGDLEEFGTPRPSWEICGDYIGGGWSRWKELSAGLTSKEKLNVILKELGPAAQSSQMEYFEGLGSDPVVPDYLKYNGKVRNLRLSRRDISILINDIWTAKAEHDKETAMQDYLSKYFNDRYQQTTVRAEWAYNLCSGCEQMLDDPQIKLFWGVLNGQLSQDIYYGHKTEWTIIRDNLLKIATGVKGCVSKDDFEKCLKTTFPLKSEVEIKNIFEVTRRQIKIKPNATEVDVDKLFTENEEGFDRTDLAKELLRQRQISQEKYIREIITQLGGKKSQNKLISVNELKRAFVILDPHIDHIVLESNIRWAFADKSSDLNMIYPITLKALATKLSSGNIQRVGPRFKGKTKQ